MALLLELTRRLDSTMIPLMLSIAGAMLVARLLEARSIYSGRIHAAREAVPEDRGQSISAAARTPKLLRALLAQPHSELDVIDQDGRSLGSMTSEDAVTQIDSLHPNEIRHRARLATGIAETTHGCDIDDSACSPLTATLSRPVTQSSP